MQFNEADNPSRILKMVENHPGIHLREIQRGLGASFSTVRYHVRNMVSHGVLDMHRDARYVRVFPRAFPVEHRSLATAARGVSTMRVLRQILNNRGASNKEISEGTGLSKSTVSREVGVLVGLGLVRRSFTQTGRKILLPETATVGLLSQFYSKSMKTAVKNYVELWEF